MMQPTIRRSLSPTIKRRIGATAAAGAVLVRSTLPRKPMQKGWIIRKRIAFHFPKVTSKLCMHVRSLRLVLVIAKTCCAVVVTLQNLELPVGQTSGAGRLTSLHSWTSTLICDILAHPGLTTYSKLKIAFNALL